MNKKMPREDERVKRRVMGVGELAATYAMLLLIVGMQTGIVVLPAFSKWSAPVQVGVIMGYWAIVAIVFSFITNHQIKTGYDRPMRRLSDAAKKVAEGDFSVYVEPMHTADKYDYIDVMFTDFNVMVQELGSIETLKNDFVANVSHELKTPLAVIRNYTNALRSESLSPDMREEYMKTIVGATDNLSTLVSNILKLNKLDNQEIELPMTEYDLCAQLCNCIFQFDSLWEEKGIEFYADIEEKATISANDDMLEIVWNNLLSNALKFTSSGGNVSLTQTSEHDTVIISVSDTGCGMDGKTQRRIFDKFYQGDTSHSGEGNGLGLALACRVVEKMGGTFTVVSELGKGSTFTVTLPTNH